MKNIAIQIVLIGLCSACLPGHLQKYRKGKKVQGTDNSLLYPEQAMPAPVGSNLATKSNAMSTASTAKRGPQASIYAIDKQIFRFLLKESTVWDSAISVLMRNYNLNIVDEKSGIITTEWDSYYLDNAVYRNKISLRVRRSSWTVVDVTIHNNVERLRDASQAAGTVGAVWLPTEDAANEVARVIQNMALILNQPPPVLPPGMAVAKDVTGDISPVKR